MWLRWTESCHNPSPTVGFGNLEAKRRRNLVESRSSQHTFERVALGQVGVLVLGQDPSLVAPDDSF